MSGRLHGEHAKPLRAGRPREPAPTTIQRLGITGHTALTPPTVDLVAMALRRLLSSLRPTVVGVSCLARGADRIFAATVLDMGDPLEVLLPSQDYRHQIADATELAHYDHLVSQASQVSTMPYRCAGPAAYSAASSALVNRVDCLVAVWDGKPDRRPDSTAAAVRAAHAIGVPVIHIWPAESRPAGPEPDRAPVPHRQPPAVAEDGALARSALPYEDDG